MRDGINWEPVLQDLKLSVRMSEVFCFLYFLLLVQVRALRVFRVCFTDYSCREWRRPKCKRDNTGVA